MKIAVKLFDLPIFVILNSRSANKLYRAVQKNQLRKTKNCKMQFQYHQKN